MMAELRKHDAISSQNEFPFAVIRSMRNEPTKHDAATLYSSVTCSPKHQCFELTVMPVRPVPDLEPLTTRTPSPPRDETSLAHQYSFKIQ